MKLTKGNDTIEIANDIQARAFLSAGWLKTNDAVVDPVAQEEIPAPPDYTIIPDDNAAIDYDEMSDESLAGLAISLGIDIEGLTRRKVINAIKRKEA